MCGICGLFDPAQTLEPSRREADVAGMMQEFAYRGPDERGVYIDPAAGLALGHVRLSIIGLQDGQQPMAYSDGQLRITFNGEIYNYQEERQTLEKQGASFRTHSDTEVILALYDRYGTDAWAHLRGQFAFALWDGRQKQLFLVRDRLGEKPLVFSYHKHVLLFASELKTLLRSHAAPKRLDPSVIGLYMLMQHVPAPHTFLQDVQKLPPGYFLRATSQGIEIKPYWMPALDKSIERASEQETVDRFRSLFQEAVGLCTVSDVPVGTFLSGGLDSTSVTWAAARATQQPLHSFAIFNREDHERHPDWRYAQEAAAFLHTEHHTVFYDLPDLMKLIPDLIERTDEPFQGPTGLVSFYLSRFTRRHVKVVLTGGGGDELMGGFQAYYQRVLRMQNAWQAIDRWVPQALRQGASTVLGRLHPALGRAGLRPEERRIAATLRYHARWFDKLCPGQAPAAQQKFIQALEPHALPEQTSYFKRYLWDDLLTGHAHSVTTLPDATGMACSLEARSPFLDYKLVEFLISVNPEWLIRKTYQNKYLLIKAMESRIPNSILYRGKMGFSGMTETQIVHWGRTEGRGLFRDQLLESRLVKEGLFPKQGVEDVWKLYTTAPTLKEAVYYFFPLWSASMLALWHERHIASA